MTMCEFKIKLEGEKDEMSTLLVSTHLKAGDYNGNHR